jgi:hypothetical protein
MTGESQMSVVMEAAMENPARREILQLDPDSSCTTDVRGRGPGRTDRRDPQESRRVRIDVLCSPAGENAFTSRLSNQKFRGYSIAITLSEVTPLRSQPL